MKIKYNRHEMKNSTKCNNNQQKMETKVKNDGKSDIGLYTKPFSQHICPAFKPPFSTTQ